MAGFLDLPERSSKPRERGLTHVLDKGLSVAEVDGLIEVAGDSVDIVKLGWGTALVTGNLEPKLARYRAHGIPVVLGGTLTEIALRDGPHRRAASPGCASWASATSRSPTARSRSTPTDKRELIARLAARVHRPLRGRLQGRRARSWPRTAGSSRSRRELEAGAWKVIAEARETGHRRHLPPRRRGRAWA